MRNSSVEIFRIIATLLVLIVHFNGWFVGIPERFEGFTLQNISQDFIEALSCTGVNCFLIITGWFGISFKWKHVWTIYSILVWIYVPLYFLEATIQDHISIHGFLWSLFAFGKAGYYIMCYMMLMFLSPIINGFIQKYGRKILPYSLAFWGIEIIFDWVLSTKSLGFGYGYMLTHFILMYLLAQTAFLYKTEIYKAVRTKHFIIIYFVGAIIITCLYFYLPFQIAFAYSNPLNIIMSFSLFFIFERRSFHNKYINWISKSTLAVYIIHITPPVINYLREWDNYAMRRLSNLFNSMCFGYNNCFCLWNIV